MDDVQTRTGWYAVRVVPAGLLGLAGVCALIGGDWWASGLLLACAASLVGHAHMQALHYRAGYYRGRAEVLEALGRAHSPDEMQRLLAVENPDPWAPR